MSLVIGGGRVRFSFSRCGRPVERFGGAGEIADVPWALAWKPDRFARAFDEEQYTRRGAAAATVETDLERAAD